MEPRAHHILIGTFTLAVALGAMLFGLWLAKSSNQGDTKLYDIVFNESVTGLTIGNAVNYSGIRVGEVIDLHLDTEDPRKVWARIRIASSIPISTSTRARHTIANITGTAIIQLESGPPGSPPLKSKSSEVPIIKAELSPFKQLRTSSEELLANITQLVDNASKVLSDKNTQHLTHILANLDSTTSTLAGKNDSISSSIDEFRKTLTQTAALMEKANKQFEKSGGELFENAQNSLKTLAQISTKVDELITNNQEALSQGAQGLTEVGPTLQVLRATLSNLEDLTRRLEEDPAGYLLKGEKIREYQP